MIFHIHLYFLFALIGNLIAAETKIKPELPLPPYVFEADKTERLIDLKCDYQKQMNIYHSMMSRNPVACERGRVRRKRCIKPIADDGNCLFRAISYLLYRSEDHHADVRKKIVDYVAENWDNYSPYIIGSDSYKGVNSSNDYRKFMGRASTWGDEIELNGAIHTYKIRLHVFTDKKYFHKMGEEYDKTYALLFTKRPDHYRVVEDVFKSCIPKKRTRERNAALSRRKLREELKRRRRQRRSLEERMKKLHQQNWVGSGQNSSPKLLSTSPNANATKQRRSLTESRTSSTVTPREIEVNTSLRQSSDWLEHPLARNNAPLPELALNQYSKLAPISTKTNFESQQLNSSKQPLWISITESSIPQEERLIYNKRKSSTAPAKMIKTRQQSLNPLRQPLDNGMSSLSQSPSYFRRSRTVPIMIH